MKINNSLDVARWEKLECKCNHDSVMTEYPVVNCEHCRCQECWDSVPKENFEVNEFDEEGNISGTRTVNEITLVRGKKNEDVMGWTF